jgi:class 3 adenylate cyclase/tetratricopeptide (TPR) repeat protein
MDVVDWLRALGLEQYSQQFSENHVTWDLVPTLTVDDLRELGISSVGHRRRLLDAISALPIGSAASKEATQITSQSTEGDGERRQVTVLFADLTGYTELSTQSDAEEVEAMLTAFFEIADATIVEHGGTIDKHIGDCVMAIFGAPLAHGNDAERAVLAALQLRDSIPMLGKRLGREIDVHMGIASGEVVASHVGSTSYRAYTVTGESVNLAARLTDRARKGEIFLSAAVHSELCDRLDCDDLGEIELKGLASPVRAWKLLATRHISIENHTFVGHKIELNQFKTAIATCHQLRRGQVIYVRGEAGLGKTRLTEEFQRIARQAGFACHSSAVLDFGAESGRDAIPAIVRSIILDGNHDQPVSGENIEALVSDGKIRSDHAVFLYDLLNIVPTLNLRALSDAMDAGMRSAGTLAALREVVSSSARSQSLLIIIEDLHWSGDSLLTQISALGEVAVDCPLILVLTSRKDGDPISHGWQLQGPTLTIDLAPLRKEESLTLARSVFAQSGPFAVSCVERAAGNPLFLEQLLRNPDQRARDTVPDSVQSLVQARMDRLLPADKKALQAASVFGQRLSLEGLQELIRDATFTPNRLIEHALLRPFDGGLLFCHALIRDAAYATLLRSRRRELHSRAAQWFADRDLGLHAQHLDRADDAGAPLAYLSAAQNEAAHYRYDLAIALAQRGAHLANNTNDHVQLNIYLGELLHDAGKVSDARNVYEEALAESQDDANRCRAWLGIAAAKRITDDISGALTDIGRAKALAVRASVLREAAQAHLLHGNVLFPRGDLEGCLREHRQGFELARRAGSAELEAAALGGLGDAEYARGRMLSARDHFGNCIELSQRHGFGRIEVANLPMFALTRFFAGETRAALEDALTAINLAAKVGHRRAQAIAHHAAYSARHSLGEFTAARANADAALELARELKARRFEAEALAFRAELDRLAGYHLDAQAGISEALAISAETGMSYFGPIYYGIQALIEKDEARRRAALSAGEALLSGHSLSHNHLIFRRDAIEASMSLKDWDAVERHAAALEQFAQMEPLPWTAFLAARARAFASFGRGRRDTELVQELDRLRLEGQELGICLPDVTQISAC